MTTLLSERSGQTYSIHSENEFPANKPFDSWTAKFRNFGQEVISLLSIPVYLSNAQSIGCDPWTKIAVGKRRSKNIFQEVNGIQFAEVYSVTRQHLVETSLLGKQDTTTIRR